MNEMKQGNKLEKNVEEDNSAGNFSIKNTLKSLIPFALSYKTEKIVKCIKDKKSSVIIERAAMHAIELATLTELYIMYENPKNIPVLLNGAICYFFLRHISYGSLNNWEDRLNSHNQEK